MYLKKINERVEELENLVCSLIRENRELKYLGKEVKAGETIFTVRSVGVKINGKVMLLGGEIDKSKEIYGSEIKYTAYLIKVEEEECELIK